MTTKRTHSPPTPEKQPWETIYPEDGVRIGQDNFPLDDVEVLVEGDGEEDPGLAELQTVALEPVAVTEDDQPTLVPGSTRSSTAVAEEDTDTEFPDDPPAMLHRATTPVDFVDDRSAPVHQRAPWLTVRPDDALRVDPTGRPIIG